MPVDMDLIPALLSTNAGYIGLIGSRRRWALTAKELQEQRGLTEAQLQRIHAPIGLEIGADTPEEIAVSIVAQLIQSRRGRKDRRRLSNYERIPAAAHVTSV